MSTSGEQPKPAGNRVAAIDVGSNTVLCLVADVGGEVPIRVSDEATITGLGRGVFDRGMLDDAAMERTLEAIGRHAEAARRLGARMLVGVGTSALREARDRDRFVRRARGLLDAFDVIDGETEARLTYEGATVGLSIAGERAVLDIGGGSTEIARGETEPRSCVSLPLGSVRLHERRIASDPPSSAELARLREDIEHVLDAHDLLDLPPLVALAGTATTVACVARSIPWREVERVHGLVLDREEIERVARELASRTRHSRANDPCIEPARADVLVAGAEIFAAIVRRSRSRAVTISDGGLRWAIAQRLGRGEPVSGLAAGARAGAC